MKLFVLSLTLSISIQVYGLAQAIPHEDCTKSGSQTDINWCVVRNFKIADHILDSVYHLVLFDLSYEHGPDSMDTSLPDTLTKRSIIRSQQAWLKYRDEDSRVILAFYSTGSAANAESWVYKTKLTMDRINELLLLREYSYGREYYNIGWSISH